MKTTTRRSAPPDVTATLAAAVRDALARLGPVERGQRVLAAVSGGPDSLVLLHVLSGLAKTGGFELHAVHFDHGLRGAESAGDARFVQTIASEWGVPVHLGRAAPGAVRVRGRGLQAAAREARYAFFDQAADDLGARWIATAHTADDQAETVILRWVRGAGADGLAGIPAVRGRYLRPLLGARRAEIEAYVAAQSLSPRRDPSNDNVRFARTQIRRAVVPLLRDLNPRVEEAFGRAAALLADDAAWLNHCAEEHRIRLARPLDDGSTEVNRLELAALHPALRRRVIRRMLTRVDSSAAWDIPSEAIERIVRDVPRRRSGRLTVGSGVSVEFAGAAIRIASVQTDSRPQAVVLAEVGDYAPRSWGIAALAVERAVMGPPAALSSLEAAFDIDRLPGMLAIRGWRRGDVFFPEGMRGRKRLHDYFIDAHVPRWRRDRIPLLVAGDDVIWVIGARRDRRYLAEKGRAAILVRVGHTPSPLLAAAPPTPAARRLPCSETT